MNCLEVVAARVPALESLLQQWQPDLAREVEQKVMALVGTIDEELKLVDGEPNEARSYPNPKKGRTILSAGGLVWRDCGAERQLAVIHRKRYDDWGLPKGKLKRDETLTEAARREVLEETGCEATVRSFAGLLHYLPKARPKLVFFWHMAVVHQREFRKSSEVDWLEWLPVAKAREWLSYDLERDLVLKAKP